MLFVFPTTESQCWTFHFIDIQWKETCVIMNRLPHVGNDNEVPRRAARKRRQLVGTGPIWTFYTGDFDDNQKMFLAIVSIHWSAYRNKSLKKTWRHIIVVPPALGRKDNQGSVFHMLLFCFSLIFFFSKKRIYSHIGHNMESSIKTNWVIYSLSKTLQLPFPFWSYKYT